MLERFVNINSESVIKIILRKQTSENAASKLCVLFSSHSGDWECEFL